MHRAAEEIPAVERCKSEESGSRYCEWVRVKTGYSHQAVMDRRKRGTCVSEREVGPVLHLEAVLCAVPCPDRYCSLIVLVTSAA